MNFGLIKERHPVKLIGFLSILQCYFFSLIYKLNTIYYQIFRLDQITISGRVKTIKVKLFLDILYMFCFAGYFACN